MEYIILILFGLVMILIALIVVVVSLISVNHNLKKDLFFYSRELSDRVIEGNKEDYSLFLAFSIKNCLKRLGE